MQEAHARGPGSKAAVAQGMARTMIELVTGLKEKGFIISPKSRLTASHRSVGASITLRVTRATQAEIRWVSDCPDLGADSGAPAGTVATGHVHGLPVLDLSTGATPVAADLSMWFAHLAAAVLTVAALYRGERLVIRLGVLARELLAWVRRRILSGVVRLPAVAERPGIVCTPAAPLRSAPVVSLVRRRGPPLSFVV